MLIHHPKAFWRGIFLLASFAAVFIVILSPVFPSEYQGRKTNGLVYADHMFNTLSKGSANFFDKSLKSTKSVNYSIQAVKGKVIDLTFPLPTQEAADNALVLFEKIGINAALTNAAGDTPEEAAEATAAPSRKGVEVSITQADLFVLLNAMITDAEMLYHNDDAAIGAQYDMDGRLAVKTWWQMASSMIKPMQRVDLIPEAAIVHTVQTKALEASYNFYGITAEKVSDNILLVIAFLLFYVLYTMWYGFSIFELFDGIGLSMNKGKKQEA